MLTQRAQAFAALVDHPNAQFTPVVRDADATSAISAASDPLDDLIRMGLVKQGPDGTHPVRHALYRRLLQHRPSRPTTTRPWKLFYSYAQADKDRRDRLDVHLALLQRDGLIESWHHWLIPEGTESHAADDAHLAQVDQADIILLLVSADFLASLQATAGTQMRRALERHDAGQAVVVSVLVRPCDWQSAPFAKKHVLPKNALPVSRWTHEDDAWADIALGLRQCITDEPAPASASGPTLASKSALPSPSPTYLLHLSDLHIRTSEQAKVWANQLIEDVIGEQRVLAMHGIIVSGDIGNYATEDEYRAAQLFFQLLQDEFHVPGERILLVPGNHDLSWPLGKAGYELHMRESLSQPLTEGAYIVQGEAVQVRQDHTYGERFRDYAKFHQAITQTPYSLDYHEQVSIIHLADHDILLVGFNSAWNIDHYFRARASIHPGALASLLTHIRKDEAYAACATKIAVWHHPLHSPDPDRITDHGFVEQLAKSGFRLALHGHMHKADSQLYHYDCTPGGRRLHVVAAGTFGAPVHEWQPGYPLQYNLLKLAGQTLTVHTRRREQLTGAWKPDARWTRGKGQDPLPRYTIQLDDTSPEVEPEA